MKKILFFCLLIILIPLLIVSIFIKKEKEIEFKYSSDMLIRVKRSNGIFNIYFEDYIVGVLAGEMPTDFELEALKAQAVAARSYAMVYMARNYDKDYDVVDTVSNQVYLSYDELKDKWKDNYISKINKLKTAVLETKGEYMEYKGEVVEAMFFSTSVGMTENSEEIFSSKKDYLRSVTSYWDKNVSPVFSEDNSFLLSDFYKKLGLPYKNNIDYKILSKTSTGRIKEIFINGVIFSGSEVMSMLGIRSSYFSLVQNGDYINVTTKGYGHGVGMSQYGAYGMAKEGYTYDKILKHYYQGIEIKKL